MNSDSSKPIIDLFNFDGLGLIIIFPSNVIYTNQVAGYACLHPEIEGVFVPLTIGHKKVLFELENHFKGDWHYFKDKDAEIIDRLLRGDGFGFIKVDRTKLENSFEAWVYVEIDELSEKFSLIKSFGKAKGILTWANSD